jgi:hypothetical protein
MTTFSLTYQSIEKSQLVNFHQNRIADYRLLMLHWKSLPIRTLVTRAYEREVNEFYLGDTEIEGPRSSFLE